MLPVLINSLDQHLREPLLAAVTHCVTKVQEELGIKTERVAGRELVVSGVAITEMFGFCAKPDVPPAPCLAA